MSTIRLLTGGLFLLVCFVGIRVEWLNAHSGYRLPVWKSISGEEESDRSRKLGPSPLALDFFWTDPKRAQKLELKNRPKLQAEALYWNKLLDFKLFALLQFPMLFLQGLLLVWWRCQKLTRQANLLWWFGFGATTLLLTGAFYRDYSYGLYGL